MRDFISQLPDELLHKILLNLKTSESVRTSVLSSRWRHLWQSVPGLIFNGDERDVKYFLDRFLSLHKELPIYQFILDNSVVDILSLKLLIEQILTRRVQILRLDGSYRREDLGMIEIRLYFCTCESLVNLHLICVKLDVFDGSEFINLPRLQVMHLDDVSISSDVVLEMLISCSPVLQELRISGTKMEHVKVRSQMLRSLTLTWIRSRVVIDTPKLEFLSINDSLLKYFQVERVSSSLKLCIGAHNMYGKDIFSNMQTWHKIFVGILQVTDLSISGRTLKQIFDTCPRQCQILPEFRNLTRLYACFSASFLEMLPLFLSSCPNLKSLDLEFHSSPKMEEIANSPVPECLQTSIEYVQIKMSPKDERSRKAQIKFAKYILKNAIALKKLTVWLDEEDMRGRVFEQIPTFYRPVVDVMIRRAASNHRLGFIFDKPESFSRLVSSWY